MSVQCYICKLNVTSDYKMEFMKSSQTFQNICVDCQKLGPLLPTHMPVPMEICNDISVENHSNYDYRVNLVGRNSYGNYTNMQFKNMCITIAIDPTSYNRWLAVYRAKGRVNISQ